MAESTIDEIESTNREREEGTKVLRDHYTCSSYVIYSKICAAAAVVAVG